MVAVKVKYIDKRHWRRIVDREYTEVKVNNNKFKGIIGLVTRKSTGTARSLGCRTKYYCR